MDDRLMGLTEAERACVPQALEALKPYMAQGPKGTWKWEDPVGAVLTALNFDLTTRKQEYIKYACMAIRAKFPSNENLWATTRWDDNTLTSIVVMIRNEALYRLVCCDPAPEKAPRAPSQRAGRPKADGGAATPPPPKPELPSGPAIPPPPPSPV